MTVACQVKSFLHPDSNTFTYLVTDPVSKATAVVDSVLDFDSAAFSTETTSCDALISYVEKENLDVCLFF
jgi:hypothetical protein